MKKLLQSIIFFSVVSTAFAAATPEPPREMLNKYYSSTHPRAIHGMQAGMASYPATDITVVNATVSVIHVVVPGTPIDDVKTSETNDHIWHDYLTSPTHLNLVDPYGNIFFDRYVCRLAVVSVFGYPGSYRFNIDETYCNRP